MTYYSLLYGGLPIHTIHQLLLRDPLGYSILPTVVQPVKLWGPLLWNWF